MLVLSLRMEKKYQIVGNNEIEITANISELKFSGKLDHERFCKAGACNLQS